MITARQREIPDQIVLADVGKRPQLPAALTGLVPAAAVPRIRRVIAFMIISLSVRAA
jgi:hypothetical protein